MYTVGSVADFISGGNTPNKPKLEVKQMKATPFKKNKMPAEAKSPQENTKPQKKPFSKKQPAKGPVIRKGEQKTKKQEEFKTKNFVDSKGLKKNKPQTENRPKINAVNDPERANRTIFVGNVPLTAKKAELLKFFSKYGTIESLRFRGIPRADLKISQKTAHITKKYHPKASSQNCFVVYAQEDCAKNALEANGSVFKGHHLRVDLSVKSQHDQKNAIFVGNLPFRAKDDDLWNAFESCGKIESVRVIRDTKTRVGKGYGYVNFASSDSVELALQMTDVKIENRELRITRCSAQKQNKKRNEKGEKNRQVPRTPKSDKKEVMEESQPKVNEETDEESDEEMEVDESLAKQEDSEESSEDNAGGEDSEDDSDEQLEEDDDGSEQNESDELEVATDESNEESDDESAEETEQPKEKNFVALPKKQKAMPKQNFQGVKFTDKKQKKKVNKSILKKKRMSKMLAT